MRIVRRPARAGAEKVRRCLHTTLCAVVALLNFLPFIGVLVGDILCAVIVLWRATADTALELAEIRLRHLNCRRRGARQVHQLVGTGPFAEVS